MKSRSAKAKGRRIIEELREAILRAFPELQRDDILIQPTSVGGEDLKLSPAARMLFPFAVEGKNKESLNIWSAIAQAQANAKGNPPAVVFRRNNMKEPWCCIPLPTLLNLLQRIKSPLVQMPVTHRKIGKYDKPYHPEEDEDTKED